MKQSQATLLIECAAGVELFRTPDRETFAVVDVDTHRETWAVRGGDFRHYLRRRYYEQHDGVPNAQALQDALGVLEAEALFLGEERTVAVRLGEEAGAIFLDLADHDWRAVRVDAEGWRVVDDAPVRFRRTRGMAPLPVPVAGGTLDELRPFVNAGGEGGWQTLVAFAVMAFRPHGPYPVLGLHGEQGSAKSTTARVLRSLIDPATPPLRAAPREERDLMIAARNAWILAFDNLSSLPQWLSDALCRVATGGGFATRELYANAEEMIFDAQRPVILNGIEELAASSDLLDRIVILNLPTITEDNRRDEEAFWAGFERVRPRVLGSLLDGVSTALRRWPDVTLDRLPRMADFTKWVTAAEPGLGWSSGTFAAIYAGNREQAHEIALDASPLGPPLRELAREGFEGTPSELLAALTARVGDEMARAKGWPKSARVLSGKLTRLAPNLRALGVEITYWRTSASRMVRLGDRSVTNVTSVTEPPVVTHDDDDDAGIRLSHGFARNGGEGVDEAEVERLAAEYGDLLEGEA